MAGYIHRQHNRELYERMAILESELKRERATRLRSVRVAREGKYLVRYLTTAEAELEEERTINWARARYPESDAVKRSRLEQVTAEGNSWIDPTVRARWAV